MANNLLKSSGLWKLQQGDCAQVTFYIHNLTFIWLTDVLVLQLIYTGSSTGTKGDQVQLDFNFGAAVSASSEVASGSLQTLDMVELCSDSGAYLA